MVKLLQPSVIQFLLNMILRQDMRLGLASYFLKWTETKNYQNSLSVWLMNMLRRWDLKNWVNYSIHLLIYVSLLIFGVHIMSDLQESHPVI